MSLYLQDHSGSEARSNLSDKYTERLFSIRSLPLRYLVIPKCGCTFVKNLFWRLEHGSVYPDQLRIHDADGKFERASDFGLTADAVRLEDFAFTVLRNPVERFYSLYADKVVGNGHKKFVPLRKTLLSKYGLNGSPSQIVQHQENCEILIDWIDCNLKSDCDIKKNPHWTPQSYRKNIMGAMNLKLLLVRDLNKHLPVLLGELVPNLTSIFAELEVNRSKKTVRMGEVLTVDLRKKINNVYREDRMLFQLTRDAWAKMDIGSNDTRVVPRFGDLI